MSIKTVSKQLAFAGIEHVVVSATNLTVWLRSSDDAETLTDKFRSVISKPFEDLSPLPYSVLKSETEVFARGYQVMVRIGDARSSKSLILKMAYDHSEDATTIVVNRNSNFRKFIQHGGWTNANYMINDSVGQRALRSQIKDVIFHLRDNYGKELQAIVQESKN